MATEQEVVSQVEQLLIQVTVAQDTEVLKRVTKELHNNYYKQDYIIPVLVHILQHSSNVPVRQLAAVEAKKLVNKKWNDSFAVQVRASLLDSTLAESDPKTRHASARLISAIGRLYLKDDSWPELSVFCQQASTSQRASDREIGLFVIYSLLESDAHDAFDSHLGDLLRLCSHTIHDPESRDVRQTSLLCLGELSNRIYAEDKALIKAFQEVLPQMTVVLQQAIEADNESDARNAFEIFEVLLLEESSLVKKYFRDLLQMVLQISANTSYDAVYREMGLSFLASAIRYKRQRIQSLKLGNDIVQAMLRIAMEADEDPDDDDSPVRLAINNIEILANSLPPQHVVPPVLEQFPILTSSPNPNERRAAMAALGAIMEGALDFMTPYVNDILPPVFNALRDPEPMVIRAALGCLTRITDELNDNVAHYHSTIVPVVYDLLGSKNPAIMKAACTTLDAILEWIEEDEILQYLPKLMEALLYIMTANVDSEAKCVVAAALGTIASTAKEGFFPYLDHTVHTFFSMKEVTGQDDPELRGVVTDNLGAIASAVGKEKFLPYMDRTFQLAVEGLKIDSSRLRESAFLFYAIMSQVLGAEFGHVLPQIMPSLIETLSQEDLDLGETISEEEAISVLENGQETEDFIDTDDDDDESIEIKVNSALQLEKEIAADAVGEIFTHSKEAFLPYLQTATEQLLELADSYYEGSRKAAISSLWKFVMTLGELQVTEPYEPGLPLKIPLPPDLVKLADVVRKKSVDILKDENDRDVMAEIFRCLSDSLIKLGPGILGTDERETTEIIAITLLILERDHPSLNDDDENRLPDDEERAEIELVLIDAAVDVVVALAKALKGNFIRDFESFYRQLVKFTNSKNSTERSMGVASLGEITRALEGGIEKRIPELYLIFMNAVDDSSLEVSANAIYALGLLLVSTTQDFSSQYNSVLTKLQRFFADDAPRNAKDNAVGCVSRMIVRHPNTVPLDLVLPAIIRTLPLTDKVENEPTYSMFLFLYRSHNHVMLSLTEQLLPSLTQAVLNDDEQLKGETKLALFELIKALRAEYPQLFEAYSGLAGLQ